MARDPGAECTVDPSDYPAAGGEAERLCFLLRCAILAPSGHSS